MELIVKRVIRTETSTIGKLYINGLFFSNTLEPKDRDLTSDMPLDKIKAIKVPHKTCIPTGRYQVTKYLSPKHNGWVPLLLHVPGFDFVEIHSGNTAADTDACLLPGFSFDHDFVGNSKDAVSKLYPQIFEALEKHEPVWITYE